MISEIIGRAGCSAIRFSLKRELKYWREAAQSRRLCGPREDRLEFLENALELRRLLKQLKTVESLQVTRRFA